MSQTKYKLPDDVKTQCLSLVKGYDRRVKLYHDRREAVLFSSPSPDRLVGSHGGKAGDPTGDKVLRLEKIEELFDTKAMKAVEQAKLAVGFDFAEEPRKKLAEAIWDSCVEGRNFHFEYRALPMCRDTFYERRRRFLWAIANNMGFIEYEPPVQKKKAG